jgi:hypothetical protein
MAFNQTISNQTTILSDLVDFGTKLYLDPFHTILQNPVFVIILGMIFSMPYVIRVVFPEQKKVLLLFI